MHAMAAEALPRQWHWIRGLLRAALAAACLIAQLASPAARSSPVTVVVIAYAAYAAVAAVWKKFAELEISIAGLCVETMFFVVFSVYGADRGGWLGSLLFLYLMVAAVVMHEWGDVLIVAGSSIAFFAFVRSPEEAALKRVVVIAGLLGCAMAYYKRRLRTRVLEAQHGELQARQECERIRDAERQRIAADFHDGPLQSFIALQVRLDILGALLKRDRTAALEDLKELQAIAKSQVAEIRSFLRGMKPLEVDTSDLVASARRIVEYFKKDTGIDSRFMSTESAISAPQELGREILQILREALNNVQKHSKAARVVVSLEQNGRMVELSVDDDGTGFAFSGSFSLDELDLLRLGPQSIKRRVRSLGGELQLESRPGHGAGLNIRVPC